jgi:hypothetical protein
MRPSDQDGTSSRPSTRNSSSTHILPYSMSRAISTGEASTVRCRRLTHGLGQPCSGHQHLPTQKPCLHGYIFEQMASSWEANPPLQPCRISQPMSIVWVSGGRLRLHLPVSRLAEMAIYPLTDLLQQIDCSITISVLADLLINRLHHWF